MLKILFFLTILLVSTNYCFSFDKNGHRIIAQIAFKNLSAQNQIKLRPLLGNKALEEVANWPDEIRLEEGLSKPSSSWHYVNFETEKYQTLDSKDTYENLFNQHKNLTYEEIQKKFKPDPSLIKGDLIWAITTFQKILKDKKKNSAQRAEALRFLVHFVGDLHQPLHCGYASDRGGTDVEIKWYYKTTSLHAVWDSEMIDMSKLSYSEYVNFINKKDEIKINEIQKGDVMDWAYESKSLVSSLYAINKEERYRGKEKELNYHHDFVHLLNERLYKAGIRLAKILTNSL